MIEKIEHRGPDETQVYRSLNVPAIMAHCRLSIIGPSDGSQPIYSANNILVANGEIYNYRDLRAILGESAFETRSDSETILHLFRSNQLRWVTKLDGMFAFVLATPERIIAATAKGTPTFDDPSQRITADQWGFSLELPGRPRSVMPDALGAETGG